MSNVAGQEGITIQPAPSAWLESLRKAGPNPIIMTGHQAEFWHPGILAKYLAAQAAADVLRSEGRQARVVWLVADQDSNEPWKVSYPSQVEGMLTKATWAIPFKGSATATTGAFAPDTPTCTLPPLEASSDLARTIAQRKPASASVDAGLRQIEEALTRHRDAPNAARQVALALSDLLAPWCRADEVLFATSLSSSKAFSTLVDRMLANPRACVLAYNGAVAQVPAAHMRPLKIEGDRIELPLWRLPSSPGRARRPVFAGDLGSIPPSELAPRALLMTALVRMSACDLFIHGLGGGVYDQVTDLWLTRWMPEARLAPTAVVTATRHLRFEGTSPRTPREIARAQWLNHHAKHSPGELGDSAAETRRRDLVAAIKSARSRGQAPAEAFRELHGLLERVRQSHTAELSALEAQARSAAADIELARVVYDRTWPFPLYPREALDDLMSEVRSSFTHAHDHAMQGQRR